MLPTPANLTLDEIQKRFSTDDAARAYLEEIRWSHGVICPHCRTGNQEKFWEIKPNKGKKIRAGLRQCVECKKQFTVTVGTIFEDSHIPLRKWLVAWYLLCSSKKGISSLQIQRMLRLGSFRTALFMMHRIRHALKHPSFTQKLPTSYANAVEVDETYIGGKCKPRFVMWKKKTPVVALVERGGQVRSQVMERVTARNLRRFVEENVNKFSYVNTDDHMGYRALDRKWEHGIVKHSAKEYVRGDVHPNTVEGFLACLNAAWSARSIKSARSICRCIWRNLIPATTRAKRPMASARLPAWKWQRGSV